MLVRETLINEISPLAVAILNRYFNGIWFMDIFHRERGGGGNITIGRAISTPVTPNTD